MRWRGRGQCESLADELSSSLATIAREERRKVQYQRGDASSFGAGRQSKCESDGGGDASEESWLSFLGTQSASEPPLVTATTSSGSDDRYSSNGGRTSNDSSQRHRHVHEGPGPPSDGHGLPKPVDDRVGPGHGNVHASVLASLPPPQLRSGGGGSSSSVRSASSCEQSRSSDEGLCTNKYVKRAPPEISKTDNLMMKTLPPKQKKRRTARLSMSYDDEESSSSSGSEGGYDASSSDNRVQQSSCSSPSVSSSEDGHVQFRRMEFIGRSHHAKRHSRRSHSVESSVSSSSSELADYSSSSPARLSDSASASSSEGVHRSLTHQKKRSHDTASAPRAAFAIPSLGGSIGASNKMFMATMRRHQQRGSGEHLVKPSPPRNRLKTEQPSNQQAPIFSLGCDMMAHCMSYLEPMEVHSLLTVPLSKQWRDAYTVPQDLWRVLCLMDPSTSFVGPSS